MTIPPIRKCRCRKSPRRRRQAGFTLLEVMAATAVLAMVGLVIAASLNAFYRSWTRGEKVARELERNRAVDRVVDELFRNAVPLQWEEELGNVEYVFQGEQDELWIAALGRSYGGRTPFRFGRLYLEDDQLRCDYAETPLLPWIEIKDQQYETLTITDNVQSIQFAYADDAEEDSGNAIEFYDEWDEEEHDNFPLAILLTIEWKDGSRECWLRRTAANSYNTELSVSQRSVGLGGGSADGLREGGGGPGGRP